MKFRVLGPLEADEDEQSVPLGGPKRRAVLALLLLNANRVVSADSLVDQLWGDEAAFGASKTLQVHISQLRRALSACGGRENIATQPPGYRMDVGPAELDLLEFGDLVRR